MSELIEIAIPKIGESISTVFLGSWLKAVGDAVTEGEALVEIDSEKATLEVPAPTSGVLVEIRGEAGAELPIGQVVAVLRAGAASTAVEPGDPAESARAPQSGPAARHAAAAAGVDLADITGSGVRGRVLRRDVEAHQPPAPQSAAQSSAAQPSTAQSSAGQSSAGQSSAGQSSAGQPAAPAPAQAGRVERVPMTVFRRTVARHLVRAQQTAAILTTFNEIDMSAVIGLRRRHQKRFVDRYGRKLGFMSFFVKAVIEGLKAYPELNAEIDESNPRRPAVLYKRYYNIGVAVSTPPGLMVPVVRDADRLSFAETEEEISNLARRGRDGKLGPDDMSGGTFTISNGGVFGSLMSTPIINVPQVGILGMHTIKERPIGVNGKIELRPMMYVALSYDHRIIDGRGAVGFLVRVKELVEAPERILLEV